MVSSEKKLQLIRRIREENEMNQNTIRGREAFLYGRQTPYVSFRDGGGDGDTEHTPALSTFRLRITAALLLFGVFYSLVSRDEALFGIGSEQVYEAVETDYSTILFDFMNQIPYTLHK